MQDLLDSLEVALRQIFPKRLLSLNTSNRIMESTTIVRHEEVLRLCGSVSRKIENCHKDKSTSDRILFHCDLYRIIRKEIFDR